MKLFVVGLMYIEMDGKSPAYTGFQLVIAEDFVAAGKMADPQGLTQVISEVSMSEARILMPVDTVDAMEYL